MDDAYIVKPVYKALRLLEAVGEVHRDLTLGEICTLTDLPKSTAFKYLRTLCACGFVAHDSDTDRYHLGLAIWRLGRLSDEQQTVQRVVAPAMRALRDKFEETVNLGILDRQDIVYLDIAQSRRSLRMQAALGGRDPAYSTGLGKAILAFLDGNRWRSHVPARLTARTDRTVTSVDDLRAELQIIRRRGYALDRGENEEGLSCVAAPILAVDSRVVAALSLSMPGSRMTRDLQRDVIAALIGATQHASEQLGYLPAGR